jgi:thymidylate kinase
MIITFMGNDGSGKTTLARASSDFFKELGFETICKHEYEYVLLKYLFRLIGKKKTQDLRNEMISETDKKSVIFRVWPMLVWIDLLFQYFYFKIVKRKSVVVLDRYPYDHYMSFKHLGNLTNFTERLYLHFPRPDFGIILVVEPELAYERKKATHNYPLVFYRKQTQQYLNLAKTLKLPAISTKEEITETLKQIITIFLRDKKGRQNIFKQGSQNRVIYNVLKKFGLSATEELQSLLKDYARRQERAIMSIHTLKKILKNSGVESYGLIKTIDDFEFVGNDIDVLLAPADFEKLHSYILKHSLEYRIQKINYEKKKDKGKMDLFLEDGLKLDIHSYIGWRNIIFFSFNQMRDFIFNSTIFGTECKSLSDEANSVVIISHILEKGFVTLDEYLFLRVFPGRELLRSRFPDFTNHVLQYIKWLDTLLADSPKKFPVFIPPKIILRSYLGLVNKNQDDKYWKLKSVLRDLPIIILWRLRYRIKKKLPFEIDMQADV